MLFNDYEKEGAHSATMMHSTVNFHAICRITFEGAYIYLMIHTTVHPKMCESILSTNAYHSNSICFSHYGANAYRHIHGISNNAKNFRIWWTNRLIKSLEWNSFCLSHHWWKFVWLTCMWICQRKTFHAGPYIWSLIDGRKLIEHVRHKKIPYIYFYRDHSSKTAIITSAVSCQNVCSSSSVGY